MFRCLKRAPINFLEIYLFLTEEVMLIWMVLLSAFPMYLGIIFILLILASQVYLTGKTSDLCKDILEADMKPTGLYYKDGTPQKRGMDYVGALIMISLPFILIFATILLGQLGIFAKIL